MKIYKMKPEPGQNGALKINIGNGRLGKRTDIFGIIWGYIGNFNGLTNSTISWNVKKLTVLFTVLIFLPGFIKHEKGATYFLGVVLVMNFFSPQKCSV